MCLLLNLGRLIWSSVLHSGLSRFVQITGLKVNLNRVKNYFNVTGILRKLLLTSWTKLLLSLGIILCHLALLNVLFISDFLGLDLLVSWLLISFLPPLHSVLMRLWFEPFLQLELHFALFIRMCSLSFK